MKLENTYELRDTLPTASYCALAEQSRESRNKKKSNNTQVPPHLHMRNTIFYNISHSDSKESLIMFCLWIVKKWNMLLSSKIDIAGTCKAQAYGSAGRACALTASRTFTNEVMTSTFIFLRLRTDVACVNATCKLTESSICSHQD